MIPFLKQMFASRRAKVFCIGANKTGTTSMNYYLAAHGYKVAPQAPEELLIEDWARRDFTKIVSFCRPYEAFQDIPFSLPYTYQSLDQAFPGSKFILTVRNSAEEWYDSLVRFTQKRLKLSNLPSMNDLLEDNYRYRGFNARVTSLIHGENVPPFDKEIYMRWYQQHIADVLAYFLFRERDLLVVNLSDACAATLINQFLSLPPNTTVPMPHANRSLP